eukprot:4182834-Prymnesium_polylepis.1
MLCADSALSRSIHRVLTNLAPLTRIAVEPAGEGIVRSASCDWVHAGCVCEDGRIGALILTAYASCTARAARLAVVSYTGWPRALTIRLTSRRTIPSWAARLGHRRARAARMA